MKCPKCLAHLELFVGGVSGMYQCTKCDYVGPIALEEDKKEQ